jgi:uncharacterized protein GlcG (DUF336 family)
LIDPSTYRPALINPALRAMSKLLACTPPLFQRAQEHAISQRRERAGTRPAGAGVPGGVQIQDGTTLLGAIGVSRDTSDNDEICAIAGIETAGLKANPG